MVDDNPRPGSGRKFKIALASLCIMALAYISNILLLMFGKFNDMDGSHFTGVHLMVGVGLVLGLYGAGNVIDKLNGGKG